MIIVLEKKRHLPEKHLLVPPVKPTAETILYNYMCMIGMCFERRLCKERKGREDGKLEEVKKKKKIK